MVTRHQSPCMGYLYPENKSMIPTVYLAADPNSPIPTIFHSTYYIIFAYAQCYLFILSISISRVVGCQTSGVASRFLSSSCENKEKLPKTWVRKSFVSLSSRQSRVKNMYFSLNCFYFRDGLIDCVKIWQVT